MSNFYTYHFSKPGWGNLDIEVDFPSKQVFQSSMPEEITWKHTGLDFHPEQEKFNQYFFEWQKIHFTYWNTVGNDFREPIELRVNDRIIKRSEPKENIHLLTANFSFEDVVGDTRIEIRDAANRLIFRLETEVFPQKMDYKSDYKAIISEISQIIQNLTYDLFKDTFKKSRARLSGKPTQNEWWNILDALFNNLITNLGVIMRQPKIEIVIHEEVCQVQKIKQSSKRNRSWLIHNQKYSNNVGYGLKIGDNRSFTHALAQKKKLTYDTFENRFVVWAMKNILEQLRKFKVVYQSEEAQEGIQLRNNLEYSPVLKRIELYQGRLQGIIHESPFNEATEFEKRSFFSTTLTRGAGYRDFLQIYLLLSRGLELFDNEIFKIEQKNISLLYEYWCFLKLVQIAIEQNGNELCFQDLIKIQSNKYNVTLKKGEQSKVILENKLEGDTTTIYYNREFRRENKKVYTFNQIPDFTIKIKKRGFENPFWFLFDSKYRFDEFNESDGQRNYYNVPQDAIGQLHRYRDAILHTEPVNTTYRSAIKNLGGVILYPYPLSEDEFKSNIYYKSIGDVNIGALPFLPSKTKLVSNLFYELLNRVPEEHYERNIEMDRSDYEFHREKWNEFVTIGMLPKDSHERRRDFLFRTKIYHVPFVKKMHSKLYLSNQILIYDTMLKESTLFEVRDWEILTDKNLTEMGASWQLSCQKYVVFNLENPKQFKVPGRIETIRGYRFTSRAGLNKYVETGDKRCFYLSNPDAARLYEELTKQKTEFEISWVDNENDPSLIEFSLMDIKILSSNTFSSLQYFIDNQFTHLFALMKILRLSG